METSDERTVAEPPRPFLGDALPLEPAAEDTRLAFPTVAIGASAGGVEPLLRLFSSMPADSGCAFVVVVHLAPERRSHLVDLIARSTRMPTAEAANDVAVQADHVYVIPPAASLEIERGRLHVSALGPRAGRPVAVDRFMVSLAQDQRERAIGIVLSGTDGDGAIGVKAVKAEGGLTLAQLPSSAQYSGMPDSAIATGLIDQQLAVDDMPAAILAYLGDSGLRAPANLPEPPSDLLASVLDSVRRQTGLDFTGYKRPMLNRRVRRRMGLCHVGDMARYGELVRTTRSEADALAHDFLISVTEFFREPEAWAEMAREVVPEILNHLEEDDAVRVWVPGCATGEEAYSVAMLFLEQPQMSERRLRLQVFATDIDKPALDHARKGRFQESSVQASVNAERRQRFFVKTDAGYQVRKELRDAVTFAPQNVIHDPPFSRMNLISCRNLLIYLMPEQQRRVLQLFHFALADNGYLALGKSESVGPLAPAFRTVSHAARLFCRVGPTTAVPAQRRLPAPPARPLVGNATAATAVGDLGDAVRAALLEHRPTTAVLTDREGHALYFYGPVSKYLSYPEGVPTADLYAMLDVGLRPQVRAAVHQALSERRQVETNAELEVTDADSQPVRVVVSPIAHAAVDDLCLVIFEGVARPDGSVRQVAEGDVDALRLLEDELRKTKRDLRTAIEDLEATNEELKVANEEAMSTNEELQSTNEELETSQEELQSVNEELVTVNHQLQAKVEELELVNDDLNNLLASTSIPTIFLDRQLRIKRFTPAANKLFNLLPSDVNRALTDFASHDDTRSIVDDARQVLDTLAPAERETRTAQGRHYLRRTLPYRTQEDRIDGIVITFTDVTELKTSAEGLRRFAAVMSGSSDAIVVHAADGHVLAWNRGAEAMYGFDEAQMLGHDIGETLADDQREGYAAEVGRVLRGQAPQRLELQRRHADGRLIEVSASVSLIHDEQGRPEAVALIERDVTPQRQAQTRLQESEQRFRTMADHAPVLIWTADRAGELAFVNQEFSSFTGRPRERLDGCPLSELVHVDDRARVQSGLAQLTDRGQRFEGRLRLAAADGSHRWVHGIAMRMTGQPDGMPALIGSMVNIDAQVGAEDAMRESSLRKDEFLAMLGHELRNPLAPIRTAAEVLHRLSDGNPRLTWVHEVLVRQVGHVTRMVDDLLDISRLTRGTLQLNREPVELVAALQQAVDAVAPLVESRRHTLTVERQQPQAWIGGDPIRLAQIFDNLLVNACKYTDPGGKITVTLAVRDGRATVSFKDNGIGFPPEMRARLFDLFVQDERARDRSQGGLGIGLALVKHLVELHGGRVQAFSEGSGRGAEITVQLPLLEAERVPEHSEAAPEPGLGHGRVLVVDDDRDGAQTLQVLLGLYGYEATLAHDGDTALEAARRTHPQVVLMDIAMPRTDGYQVAKRLRKLPQGHTIKFVALTGFARDDDVRRSKDEAFESHLVKPVDPKELDRLLKRLLPAEPAAGG